MAERSKVLAKGILLQNSEEEEISLIDAIKSGQYKKINPRNIPELANVEPDDILRCQLLSIIAASRDWGAIRRETQEQASLLPENPRNAVVELADMMLEQIAKDAAELVAAFNP